MENHSFQEITNKKRFLKRYRKNQECILRLEAKVTFLDEKIKSVKSPNYSGMPRGGTPVTTAELLSDKMELEERISRLKSKGKKIKKEILEEIDSLEESRYCEVLEAFCIDCKSMDEIAEDMGYSTRWIYDLYSEAVDKLTFN